MPGRDHAAAAILTNATLWALPSEASSVSKRYGVKIGRRCHTLHYCTPIYLKVVFFFHHYYPIYVETSHYS